MAVCLSFWCLCRVVGGRDSSKGVKEEGIADEESNRSSGLEALSIPTLTHPIHPPKTTGDTHGCLDTRLAKRYVQFSAPPLPKAYPAVSFSLLSPPTGRRTRRARAARAPNAMGIPTASSGRDFGGLQQWPCWRQQEIHDEQGRGREMEGDSCSKTTWCRREKDDATRRVGPPGRHQRHYCL